MTTVLLASSSSSSSLRQDRWWLGGAVAAATTLTAGLLWRYYSRCSRRDDNKISNNKYYKELPTNHAYTAELQLAVRVALQAGRNMIPHCQHKGTDLELQEHELGIEHKTKPEDFCTAIDVENETLITRAIQQKFSSHEIIGEESTGTGAIPPLTERPTWIIDPIDGTTNFASGLPMTCVSIGFCVDKRPVLGVVYAPMTDELYLAVKDKGAYRNGVSLWKEASQKKPLKQAIVCAEFGYARSQEAVSRMLRAIQNVLNHGCRATRLLGSGALDLCYVATGRLDVVYAGEAKGQGWKPWDYCAGMLIAQEAGCAIEALLGADGEEFDLYSDSIVCATHYGLLQECRQVVLKGL